MNILYFLRRHLIDSMDILGRQFLGLWFLSHFHHSTKIENRRVRLFVECHKFFKLFCSDLKQNLMCVKPKYFARVIYAFDSTN